MDIDELAKIISDAARVSFSESRQKFGKDQLIGYSIISHDTADSCGPVVATKKGLGGYGYGPDTDYIFMPVEWDQFDNGPSFDKVNAEIGTLYDAGDYEEDPDWHDKFRELVFEANVRALEILINEGFFGSEDERNNIFIIFCLSDSETFETHVPGWVKRLNTETVSVDFDSWRKS